MTSQSVPVLSGGRRGDPSLPLVTIDMDGVLCQPLFGWNATAQGAVVPPESAGAASRQSRLKQLLWAGEAFRYAGRKGMPGSEAFLRHIGAYYRLILVTARGRPAADWSRRWLQRQGLWRHLDGLAFRTDPHQSSYEFKAATVGALGAVWHIEDDGRTAMHVCAKTATRVLLIAWPQNEGEYPECIRRLPDLASAATYLAGPAQGR